MVAARMERQSRYPFAVMIAAAWTRPREEVVIAGRRREPFGRARLGTVALFFTLVIALVAAPAALARPRVTGVAFKGTVVRPTIVITGTGFGTRPAHSPSYQPKPPLGNKSPYGCRSGGDVGWDYGNKLWIELHPAGTATWSAGRFRPALKELDCVGLIAVSYSKTRISFRLGKDYLVEGYDLSAGTGFKVGVKGATKSGTVKYS
jgi:hypothetical protein